MWKQGIRREEYSKIRVNIDSFRSHMEDEYNSGRLAMQLLPEVVPPEDVPNIHDELDEVISKFLLHKLPMNFSYGEKVNSSIYATKYLVDTYFVKGNN